MTTTPTSRLAAPALLSELTWAAHVDRLLDDAHALTDDELLVACAWCHGRVSSPMYLHMDRVEGLLDATWRPRLTTTRDRVDILPRRNSLAVARNVPVDFLGFHLAVSGYLTAAFAPADLPDKARVELTKPMTAVRALLSAATGRPELPGCCWRGLPRGREPSPPC